MTSGWDIWLTEKPKGNKEASYNVFAIVMLCRFKVGMLHIVKVEDCFKQFVFTAGDESDNYSHVVMKTTKSEYLLCTLVHGLTFQQNLDLKLRPKETVTFSVQGSSKSSFD